MGICVEGKGRLMNMDFHPIAGIFPLMPERELNELAADIKANGLREPIWLHKDGRILDGRNRYLACGIAGVDIEMQTFDGADPVAFVVSLNLKRRHLDESERSMVAGKLANMSAGDNQHARGGGANLPDLLGDTPQTSIPVAAAASLLNVSERSVKAARAVLREGAAELVAAVETGKASVSAAADVATLPVERQQEIVARGEREILEAAKQIRAERAEVKRTERIEKLTEIAKGNVELGTETKYPIVYADPPWRYENPPIGAGNRAIENHYPTMTLEEICALPVAELATPDALLYLWATAPKLAECMRVITAWGFTYRTCMVWVKDKIGMGYHVRNQHELLLICKRGELPPPAVEDRISSVITAARGEHSEKPDEFYDYIEQAYPTLPKIELFCRSQREGWAVWGNQSQAA